MTAPAIEPAEIRAMSLKGEQFTIRRMMAAVAVAAVLLMGLKGYLFIRRGGLFSLLDRDLTLSGFLPPGQAVVVLRDYEAPVFRGVVPSSRQDFYDLDVEHAPKRLLAKGEVAVMEFDQGDDDDTESRLVAIKLDRGPHRGSIVAVPRGLVCKP